MMTTPSPTAIENARAHLDGCDARLADAARVRDAAHRVLASFPRVEAGRAAKIKLAVLTAEAAVEEADARWQECVAVQAAAHSQWSTLLRRALADRQRARLAAAASSAQTLAAELQADLADRDAVAQALGVADSGEHPLQAARQLVAAIQYARRGLDPPVPSRPAPRPGTTRVKVREAFWDHDAAYGVRREQDMIYDIATPLLAEALAKQLVEPVEVGG